MNIIAALWIIIALWLGLNLWVLFRAWRKMVRKDRRDRLLYERDYECRHHRVVEAGRGWRHGDCAGHRRVNRDHRGRVKEAKMNHVYREFSVQFHSWNEGIRFTRMSGDNGDWINVDQGSSRILAMFFSGASESETDTIVAALNKLVARRPVESIVEPFPDPEAIEL